MEHAGQQNLPIDERSEGNVSASPAAMAEPHRRPRPATSGTPSRRKRRHARRPPMAADLREMVSPLGELTWQQQAVVVAAFQEDPAGVEHCVRLAREGDQPRSLLRVLLTQGVHRRSPVPQVQHPPPPPIRLANEGCTGPGCRKETIVTVVDDGAQLLCDECLSRYLSAQAEQA